MPDLAWGREDGASVAWNRGDGTFAGPRSVAGSGNPLLFDFDNDGSLDLLLASPREASSLWRNDGSGAFARIEAGRFPTARDAEAVDHDRDGDLDLLLVTADGSADALRKPRRECQRLARCRPRGSGDRLRKSEPLRVRFRGGAEGGRPLCFAHGLESGHAPGAGPSPQSGRPARGLDQRRAAERSRARDPNPAKGGPAAQGPCPSVYAPTGSAGGSSRTRSAGALWVSSTTASIRPRRIHGSGCWFRGNCSGSRQVERPLWILPRSFGKPPTSTWRSSRRSTIRSVSRSCPRENGPAPLPRKKLYTRFSRPSTPAPQTREAGIAPARSPRQTETSRASRRPVPGNRPPHELTLTLAEARGAKKVMLYLTG